MVTLRVGVFTAGRDVRLLDRRKESRRPPEAKMKPKKRGEGFPGLEEEEGNSDVVIKRDIQIASTYRYNRRAGQPHSPLSLHIKIFIRCVLQTLARLLTWT